VARLRSAVAAPGTTRLAGIIVVLVGVALLIFGVVALGGAGSPDSGAAPAPASPSVSTGSSAPATPSATPSAAPSSVPTEGSGVASTVAPPPPPVTTTAAPAPTRTTAARAPLTVLNNSVIRGLADRAASTVQSRGWQVAQVGNFAGQLPATTVYYSPGNAGEEAAARELAREFPQVSQVLPRYAGLPPTPAGIVLVVTKDWS
jgi:LytR cell envelope-related transcriptional attenuator